MWSLYIWLTVAFSNAKMLVQVEHWSSWNKPSHTGIWHVGTTFPAAQYPEKPYGMKSEEKCKKYSKWVNSLSGKIAGKCSSSLKVKIIGGSKASLLEFPHMAQLFYENEMQDVEPEFGCGASLISERFLLTAAHCVINSNGPPVVARLGNGSPKSEVIVNIVESISNPKYDPNENNHDIALLRLENLVKFTNYIRPACLNTERNIKEKKAIASGWGETSFQGPTSSNLLKVTLPLMSHSECSEIFAGIDKTSMICAGKVKTGKSTCKGDSGGPLQIRKGCMNTIIGVVSFGSKTCSHGTVFTRVSNYIPWIESIVWPDIE